MKSGSRAILPTFDQYTSIKLILAAFFAASITFAYAESPQEAVKNSTAIGDPFAPGIVELLRDEVEGGFQRRKIEPQFGRFKNYAAGKLNATSGPVTGSEITGNCRLSWYNRLLRNPLVAPAEAEVFTRNLHAAVLNDINGLEGEIAIAAEKLDIDLPARAMPVAPKTPQEALDALTQAMIAAQSDYSAALSPLSQSEINSLSRNLYPVLTRDNKVGHTLVSRGMGRQLCDLLEKTDRAAMMSAARSLSQLTNQEFLTQLAKLPAKDGGTMDGVSGTVVRRVSTPAGDIIIGGTGDNQYQLDAMTDVAAVVDLGGNDTYYEGTCNVERPVFVLIDLAGNDTYKGAKPGIQGGAILGIALLVDAAGDDSYEAADLAQGSCLGGAGMLVDLAGDDTYHGVRRLQGQAIGGLGLLIERGGNDDYHAAMWAQGFGGPIGFGMLDDLDGDDHYYAGGLYYDSYEETPGYEGWSQGIGAGLRQVANGGIGVILEGNGDDVYEFDYISHGGGYWLGLGFARDFAGNDQRLGATRKAFNGSARTESRFQRFSNGFGCHYALGFLFDDKGDDSYDGTIMGVGFAWDVAVGVLCDFDGDDQYLATGGGTQGNGAQAGLGIIFAHGGNDYYRGYGQGRASSSISYHTMPECGGNFSFVIDYGGKDKYGCGAANDSYTQRGSSGGFLIDRPKQDEIEAEEESVVTKTPTKSKNY